MISCKRLSYDNAEIVPVKGNNSKIYFSYVNKSLNDASLNEKSESLQKHKKIIFLAMYEKMNNSNTYCQRNRERLIE